MSSIEHIRVTAGYAGGDWPPAEGMSIEANLADLVRHVRAFETGRGFTCTVLDPADADVIGCVCLYLGGEHDVDVREWVCPYCGGGDRRHRGRHVVSK